MESASKLYQLHNVHTRRKVVITMLNESDIDFIRESRTEILSHRTYAVEFTYTETVYDMVGTPIGKQTKSRAVEAIVTEISSASGANAERTIEGGVVFDEGDIKVDVSINLIEDIADIVDKLSHDGKEYEITAIDKKGIGERNRYEIIGRELA